MGKEKRLEKGLYSLFHQIDLHIEKFFTSYDKDDLYYITYYSTEIYQKFWLNVQKVIKKLKINRDIEEKFLFYKEKIDEIQDLSLNKIEGSNKNSRKRNKK